MPDMDYELCRRLCPDYCRKIVRHDEHGYCLLLREVLAAIGKCERNEIFQTAWKGIEDEKISK